MVSTSMLPGIGMMELSARPSNSRPGPPWLRIQIHNFDTRISPSTLLIGRPTWSGPCWHEPLRGREFGNLQELERRCGRQDSTLRRIAIKQLQSIQTTRVEVVVDVFC